MPSILSPAYVVTRRAELEHKACWARLRRLLVRHP